MKPSKEQLNEILSKQDQKLTIEQINFMFRCFGGSCSRWNTGTYKCELGLCDDQKEAINKYYEKESGKD